MNKLGLKKTQSVITFNKILLNGIRMFKLNPSLSLKHLSYILCIQIGVSAVQRVVHVRDQAHVALT